MKQFHGHYVTPEGDILSKKGNTKMYTWHNKGRAKYYERVQIYANGRKHNFYVHRIVATVYLNNGQPLPQFAEVNHIDGNPLNNNVHNLEITCTFENQMAHQELKYSAKTYKVRHSTARPIVYKSARPTSYTPINHLTGERL